MSRQHSRSPLHSRPSTLLGRRDGYYGEQYHALVRSDLWRGSENVDNRTVEGGLRWDSGSSQEVEQVDHWAKFIEAIGRAGKRKASSSMSRYHAQDGVQSFEEDSGRSPRQLPRERLSSPEASHYGVETLQRIQSPGQRRTAHDAGLVDRRCSRSSSPRHSQAKRHDRAEHGYHNEEREDRYERSSYSERSLKSNYTAHELHFKEYQDLDPQEGYTVSPRGFSPHCAPVIVEHDHGIPKDNARIHNPGRDRERQRSRDPARERGHPRNRDPSRDRECPRSRDPVRDRERPRSRDLGRDREQPRSGGPVRDQEHPMSRDPVSQREQPRSGGPVREHPRSRDPPSRQEHPRSRDLVRDREQPRSGGPVRHQEHPRSRDPIKDRDRPRSRDPQRTTDLSRDRDYAKSTELQRGRDPTRGRESSRSQERYKHGSDYNHHAGTSHDGSSSSSNYHVREDARFRTSSAERGSPLLGLQHHKEQPRMGSLSRELHGQRAVDDTDFRMDESNRGRASIHDWEEEMQTRGSHGGVLRQGDVLKRNAQHRSPSYPGPRMDFAETLKIKVDMSRPVGQSRYSIVAAVL